MKRFLSFLHHHFGDSQTGSRSWTRCIPHVQEPTSNFAYTGVKYEIVDQGSVCVQRLCTNAGRASENREAISKGIYCEK